jgi:hypothetical protein
MDELLAGLLGLPNSRLQEWLRPGRYVTGKDLAEAGVAELVSLAPLPLVFSETSPPPRRQKKSKIER